MSKGNFSRKVKVYGDDEIGQLAVTSTGLMKPLEESQSSTEGVNEESYLPFYPI